MLHRTLQTGDLHQPPFREPVCVTDPLVQGHISSFKMVQPLRGSKVVPGRWPGPLGAAWPLSHGEVVGGRL